MNLINLNLELYCKPISFKRWFNLLYRFLWRRGCPPDSILESELSVEFWNCDNILNNFQIGGRSIPSVELSLLWNPSTLLDVLGISLWTLSCTFQNLCGYVGFLKFVPMYVFSKYWARGCNSAGINLNYITKPLLDVPSLVATDQHNLRQCSGDKINLKVHILWISIF